MVTIPSATTIADGVAVKTPGDLVFPYVQKNVDRVLTIEDGELVEAFLDMTERHKMVVENSGLLTVAALKHLDCQGKNVVSVLSGGNMDVITMSSLIQHGLICRGRIFTFAVQLPDRPGELLHVARSWPRTAATSSSWSTTSSSTSTASPAWSCGSPWRPSATTTRPASWTPCARRASTRWRPTPTTSIRNARAARRGGCPRAGGYLKSGGSAGRRRTGGGRGPGLEQSAPPGARGRGRPPSPLTHPMRPAHESRLSPNRPWKGVQPMIKIAPSILSADFVNLERDIRGWPRPTISMWT